MTHRVEGEIMLDNGWSVFPSLMFPGKWLVRHENVSTVGEPYCSTALEAIAAAGKLQRDNPRTLTR